MIRLRIFYRAIHLGRIKPEIDPELADGIEDNTLHEKKIKTIRNYGFTPLPALLEIAAQKKISQVATKQFRREAKELNQIMYNIKIPDDPLTVERKKADIKGALEVRGRIASPDNYQSEGEPLEEDTSMIKSQLQKLIYGKLEQTRRDWHYYDYDEYASALYMGVRLAPNYAALKTVMNEIKLMDPTYEPETVLDFGSGMGTTIWAVEESWPAVVREFLNVEMSMEQQSLCEYLLRGASHFGEQLQNIYHRQYLPLSERVQYDMTVSAFSLLELPNTQMRIHTIENLWRKTKDLLVIVERGNISGFTVVNEARHLILDLAGHEVTSKIGFTSQTKPRIGRKLPEAHVLAPCSHEYACPRLNMSTKLNRNKCCFRVHFEPLELGERRGGLTKEDFSYVILRKRPHPSYTSDKFTRWPRIIERRNKGGGQVTHKLCCPDGCLAETTITKFDYGNAVWKVAKACNWGDLLPIKVRDNLVTAKERRIEAAKDTVIDTSTDTKVDDIKTIS